MEVARALDSRSEGIMSKPDIDVTHTASHGNIGVA